MLLSVEPNFVFFLLAVQFHIAHLYEIQVSVFLPRLFSPKDTIIVLLALISIQVKSCNILIRSCQVRNIYF